MDPHLGLLVGALVIAGIGAFIYFKNKGNPPGSNTGTGSGGATKKTVN